ncbi:MAG: DegT/DnrJ/EryC1/StrS family aminotransferase, partial [Alphaproteobacteria bacterium]|nr:DegT/DnrJ/EryC1/StrS family aminotransferase [Alphaproteobacteria bacterium]
MSARRLALFGGTPVSEKPFRFNNGIGAEEKAAVMRVLEKGELSGFIASPGEPFLGGTEVRALQDEFQAHYDVSRALGFNSATTALHAAVAATGAGPGDEVIVSPYTMSASSTAILFTGAVPIFADIEDETFGLDPASVEAQITPRTKAIMAVNIFGHPARLIELKQIAERHGLVLIEDNAQAPDALCDGRFSGTIGDIGVFSFNRHKVMQSGEGGVLVTDNPVFAEKAALVRNHGESVVADMGVDDIVNTAGLNYRMTEMEAAVAREQFKKLPRLNEERIARADRLTAGLAQIPGITPPAVRSGCRHVYYMYVMKYDAEVTGVPRDLFVKAALAEGFFARAGYLRPTYLEPLYQHKTCFGTDGFPFSA